jgi:hypothetical protein
VTKGNAMFRRIVTTTAAAKSFGVSPLWAGWRSAADDVWAAWHEMSRAPRTARHAAHEQ